MNTAGAAQITAMQNKAAEIEQSWPSDYSELTDAVDDMIAIQPTQPTSEDTKIWINSSNTQTTVQVPTYEELTELSSAINSIDEVLPKEESEWSSYPYTKTSQHYIDRTTGEEKGSAYADYAAIPYDGNEYKVNGIFSNNNIIAPILYVSGNGAVLGAEPSNSDSQLTNYELTVPSGTAIIYLCFPVNGSPNVYTKEESYSEVAKAQDVDELKDAVDEIESILPKATTWEPISYTRNSGYVNRDTAQPASSAYASYTEINCISTDLIKVSMESSCNAVIIPILYVDSSNNILGHEPLVEQPNVTLTDYLLTIPTNTAKAYLCFGVNNTPTISKGTMAYENIASADSVNGKMDAPSTTGTNGQVLTANGAGGVNWEPIPIDSTLKIAGKCADAKATGDAIEGKASASDLDFVSAKIGLRTECGINCIDASSLIGKKYGEILSNGDAYVDIPINWDVIPVDIVPKYILLFTGNSRNQNAYYQYVTNGETTVKTNTSRYGITSNRTEQYVRLSTNSAFYELEKDNTVTAIEWVTEENKDTTTEYAYELTTYFKHDSKKIIAWGDSRTYQNWCQTLPDYMQDKDWKITRAGVGGETPIEIACRQGGVPLMVDAFTIPADTTPVAVELYGWFDGKQTVSILSNLGDRYLNPVTIAGITGDLSIDSGTYYFTRSESGTQTSVDNFTRVVTHGSKAFDDEYVAIIFSGANFHFSNEAEIRQWVAVQKAMVEKVGKNVRWIIIGEYVNNTNPSLLPAMITAQAEVFCTHYVDLYHYATATTAKA